MSAVPPDLLEPVRRTVLSLSGGAPVLGSPLNDDATWYPGTWLTDPDGPTLQGLVKIVNDVWGGDRHVAAALAFKGYAWAAALPVVAGWLGHRCVPILESETLRIGIADRLPFVRLDLSAARIAVPDDPTALADAAQMSLVDGHLREIIGALTEATRIGRRLLWGSVAESVVTVATQIDGVDGARRALDLLGAPVAGLMTLGVAQARPSLCRRTCCLWFATEQGRDEYCANCPVVC